MRRLALFAALLADVAAGGYTYEDFYRPDDWEYPTLEGKAYYSLNDYGDKAKIGYKLYPNKDGSYSANLTDGDHDAASAFMTAVEASVKAAEAMAQAKYAQAQTDAFAKRLANLLMTDGFEITDSAGVTRRVRISAGSIGAALGASSGSSAPLPATIDTEFGGEPDGVSISRTADGRIQMAGADGAASSRDEWWQYYGFFVPCLVGGGGLRWLRYGGWHDRTFATVSDGGRTMLTLAGWADDSAKCGTTVSDILTEENGNNRSDHYVLTRRGTGKGAAFHYVPFGERLAPGGMGADGASITTNAADGAVSDGVASLHGFAAQEDYAIPYKYQDKLFWRTADAWADGTSVEFAQDEDGNSKLSVKGARDYAGKHSRHYFGTSSDTSAALGWHELPNVTTNVVEGDEATISSDPSVPGQTGGGGVKTLGLKGWNYAHGGDPLFLANVGGALAYVPMATASNGVPCGCTNRWEALCEWVGDEARLEGDGTLTLPDGAPKGWADGESVERTDGGKYQVKGWASAGACGATVSEMLKDPDGDNAVSHLFLAKETGSGELHYVPLGDGVKAESGVALEVVGTTGSAVCTNRLTFASDPNSNVRFAVTDEGNGNVKITVGVYYK